MKWPSSSASASRNSAKISSSVTCISCIFAEGNRRAGAPYQLAANSCPNDGLRDRDVPPIRPPIFGPAGAGGASFATESIGVTMKLMGWAIALAAAGLTRAAAVAAAPQAAAPEAATPAPVAAPADAAAAAAATPAAPAIDHLAPTPEVGMPVPGSKGIQTQVTALGQQAADFHDNWLLLMCGVISVFVLGLLLWTMI